MRLKLAFGLTVLVLAACNTSMPPPIVVTQTPEPEVTLPPADPNDPPVWGRQDCKRASTHPEIKDDFDRAKAYCEQESGAPAGQATVDNIYYCMSDRGYNYRTRAEHDRFCSERRPPARTSAR